MGHNKELIRFGDLDLISKVTAVKKILKIYGKRKGWGVGGWGGGGGMCGGHLFSLKTLLLVVDIFSYFSTKTYVVVPIRSASLTEALLIGTTTYVFMEK